MSPALWLLAIAIVSAAAMWLSVHVVPISDLDGLPVRCRRRIEWWQCNARWAYAICAIVAAAASVTHFST
jgi:protocatechuate 3,4-dioxygenase beta subunit